MGERLQVIDELDGDHPIARQPDGTLVPLKHHQLVLLHRCLMYEGREPLDIHACFPSMRRHSVQGDTLNTRVGIIGDRAGSGKSFVVLSLVRAGGMVKDMPTIHTHGMNNVHVCAKDTNVHVRANLLVVPHNLVSQWDSYVQAFCPALKVFIIKSAGSLHHALHLPASGVDELDLIICTSTYYNRVVTHTNAMHVRFNRVIFDEVDNMNIPGCVKPEAAFLWFVTASYNNLMNPRGNGKWNSQVNQHIWSAPGIRGVGFVKSLFLDVASSMTPNAMNMLVVKNTDTFVVRSMSLSAVAHLIVKCRTPKTINLLNGIADKMIINFLNAGDVTSALSFINPANRDTEDNIVTALIDKYHRALRVLDARHAYVLESANSTDQEDADVARVHDAEQNRIAKKQEDLRNKIACIRERILMTNTCCICYEDIENKSVAPCCSNSYCLKCVSRWLAQKSECPMCKANVRIADLMVVSNDPRNSSCTEDAASGEVPSEKNSKSKNLEILIGRRKPGDKILVFSSYDRALSNIGDVLRDKGVKYSYLKGNQHHITSILKAYNTTNDLDVLLINPANYGCGINMERTTDIIMLHKFDTEIERQVIGRAHRYGRESELRVWYLLYENECM